MAWSADHKTLYYCDSPTKLLEAFDFDENSGELSNRRSLMQLPLEQGVFDGMSIDSRGILWAAVWGGHQVMGIDPNTFKIIQIILMPMEKPSCTAFTGPDLKTMIVTSAAFETDAHTDPQAGNTVAFPVCAGAYWLALHEVGYEGCLMDDHVPYIVNATRWGHTARANANGYIRGMLQMMKAMEEKRS